MQTTQTHLIPETTVGIDLGDRKSELCRLDEHGVELTPFGGHLISMEKKEPTDAENETAVPARGSSSRFPEDREHRRRALSHLFHR